MFFQRLKTPGLGHNSYLLGCGEGLAVVVDPRRDVDEYLQLARENDLSIAFVFETHRQEDFEFGSAALKEMTGAQIVTGEHELFGRSDVRLAHESELTVGTTRFVALHTPGHTPESMCYAAYAKDSGSKCWGVFTGDTLFVGDTGRTDLEDPAKTADNAGIIYDSVHRHLAPLGDQALLYPAHGSGSACGGNISSRDDSSLGIERASNPVFKKSRREFIAHKVGEKMARPPYFRHMEVVNLNAGRPMKWPNTFQVLQPKDFQKRMKEGLVFDTRGPEAFAGGHIPASYNIWLGGLPAFGGWIASEQSRIFLVVDGPEEVERAVKSLARIGIDSVEGILINGMDAWREQGLPVESLATTSALAASHLVQQQAASVLDVRDEYEWNEKHIPGAHHQFVGDLEEHLPPWPKDAAIIVHCSVGHRSALAASILKRNGFSNVINMLGGITAWEKLDLPLERQASK